MDADACTIDDFGPVPVARPDTAAEVGDLVRAAAAAGQALYPLGGRTLLGLGLPPTRPGVGVDLRGLTRVIDYPARDMTVTVQAGITVAELRRLLASEGQRLPVDVPQPDRATLGGALAANSSGPRRHGFGTMRDYVIGISTINDEGQETKAGGRVVKNVAGYDLCKLHVGALGTLGVITQVTLKVRPAAGAQAAVAMGCEGPRLGGLLERVHGSRTRPACVDVLNAPAARAVAAASGAVLPEAPWVVVVGYEDSEAAVHWQLPQLMKEAAGAVAGLEARAGLADDPLWAALTEFTAWPEARLTFKAGLLPGAVAAFCLVADALPEAPLLHAHAGAGVVRGHFAADLTEGRAATMLKGLLGEALAAQGNLTVPRCPTPWKRALPVWGAPRGDAWLMRRVKEALDPRGVFNPGRFVDGI